MTRCFVGAILGTTLALSGSVFAQAPQSRPLRTFIIERDIPKIGSLDQTQLSAGAAKSNQALGQLGADIQWVHSYVAGDKTFCVYRAKDESVIRKHAEVSGFPASKITEVLGVIDPTTASK